MRRPFCMYTVVAMSLVSAFSVIAVGQDEGLPAIAREVYRPHTGLPPASVPRVVMERVVTEPPIVPPKVVDDVPVIPRAVVVPSPAVVTSAVTVAGPTILGRYSFGFYDDGNADDNWFYDYYEAPKAAAVVVKPTTDAAPGFRTNWTYVPLFERGLFTW